MWMKSRHILNSHFQSSMNSFSSSWEEQAFAKDAAGPHGGSMWPPRSYSCSFCKREFRSAQALGGHMNIHRRDRAKLKHSFSLHSKHLHHQHHNKQSQFCTLDSNPDPNSNPSFAASPSVISTHVSPFNSSIVQEHQKEIPSSSPPSCSDSDSDSEPVTLGISDSKNRCEKNTREEETTIFLSRDDYIETNLSVGLNLVLSQNIPMGSAGDDAVSYKRYKTSVPSSQFFLKRSSMEDLDLELRLGDPPKVK